MDYTNIRYPLYFLYRNYSCCWTLLENHYSTVTKFKKNNGGHDSNRLIHLYEPMLGLHSGHLKLFQLYFYISILSSNTYTLLDRVYFNSGTHSIPSLSPSPSVFKVLCYGIAHRLNKSSTVHLSMLPNLNEEWNNQFKCHCTTSGKTHDSCENVYFIKLYIK